MFFVLMKFRMSSRRERGEEMPRGLEGFVMRRALTLRFDASALANAVSRDWRVSWKELELWQGMGMMETPVLHRRSLSNLFMMKNTLQY